MITIKNYIDGGWNETSQETLDCINPATGAVYANLPNSQAEDLGKALESAERAFPSWSKLDTEKRAAFLFALADEIDARCDELAEAESIDNGKPLSVAKAVDIPRAASNFRFFANAITQFSSESHNVSGNINYTLRQALGSVACISPWNLPLYLLTWKIAPALAAGNCVVAKPSEVTPMTAFLLSEICQTIGLPKGVLSIIHGEGSGIGQALCEHPKIKAISFTGGTATGAIVGQTAAKAFKKVSLELGGKNPTIVFADCNFEKTVDEVARAAFANQGEICLCGSRILVEDSIYEDFKDALVKKVSALKVGNPKNSETNIGAIVSKQHFDKVLSYIEIAKSEGGRILCGGQAVDVEAPCDAGYFIAPTLIEGLDNTCRTNQEEIFGPVASLQRFSTDEQALQIANDSRYGLATSLWTENLSRAHKLAEELQFGIVWVNCWMQRDLRTPFGGYKDSGLGREGGLEALRFFTEPKNVCIKY